MCAAEVRARVGGVCGDVGLEEDVVDGGTKGGGAGGGGD
jgi:hypothetical protein